jgi:hypothetical protein
MDEPNEQGFSYPCFNERQVKIYQNLHNLIGQGSAAFYKDACRIINLNPPLESTTHIVAHLFREIESSLRDVLDPISNKNISIKTKKNKNEKDNQKTEILSILKSLEIPEDEPIAQKWLSLAERNSDYNLAKRTHRSALAAPRQFDNDFLESFNSMEDIFNFVLDRVRVRYLTYIELLDSLLLKSVPVKEDIDLLLNNIPQNYVTMSYFFNKLSSPAWLKPLRVAGFFMRPPEIVLNDKDGTIYSHVWPESNYLSRMSEYDPDEVVDIFLEDVPYVENVWVLGDLAETALKLSPAQASLLVDKVIYWVQAIYPRKIPDKLGQLVIHIANGGEIDSALGLAKILFEIMPDPRTKNGSITENRYFMPNPTTRFEIYDYDKLVSEVFQTLIEFVGLKAFELLCDILDSALTQSSRYSDKNVDSMYSSIWRPSIEGDKGNCGDLRGTLISVVRDCAEQIVRINEANVSILIASLDSKKSEIFHRIALYTLRKFSIIAIHLIEDHLTDKSLFDNLYNINEYKLLFKDYFRILNVNQKEIFLKWIEAGPDLEMIKKLRERYDGVVPSDDELSIYRKTWQRDGLALVRNDLPPSWKDFYEVLVKDVGDPDSSENSLLGAQTRLGSASPKSEEEFRDMSINRIIDFLRIWNPPDDLSCLSREGVGNTLSNVIANEPDRFAVNSMMFKELDIVYINALFWGLRKSKEKGNSFSWPAVLDLSQWIMERSVKDNELNYNSSNLCFKDLLRNIIEVLISGFNSGYGVVPFDLRLRVWPLLKTLSDDIDPTINIEIKKIEEGSELSLFGLSTIRGRALNALIDYALWVRNCTEKLSGASKLSNRGFDLTPEVCEILNNHLDPSFDPSLAIRAIYGMEFPRLVFLDSIWASQNANKIFPTEESKIHLWNAAWRSYLQSNRAYSDVIQILEEQYSIAIDHLELLSEDLELDPDPYKHPECKIAEHIMYLHWWGELNPDDSNGFLSKFWSKAPSSIREYALNRIGFNLHHSDDPIQPDVLNRLKHLWESRIASIKMHNAESNELKEFGWWFVSGKFDEVWSMKQLIDVLSLVGEVKLDFGVLKKLTESASQNPRDVIQCLELIIRGKQNKWQIHTWRDEIKSIIGTVLKCSDPSAAKSATSLTNYLGSLGYLDYKDLLK